eukprot:RCo000612
MPSVGALKTVSSVGSIKSDEEDGDVAILAAPRFPVVPLRAKVGAPGVSSRGFVGTITDIKIPEVQPKLVAAKHYNCQGLQHVATASQRHTDLSQRRFHTCSMPQDPTS